MSDSFDHFLPQLLQREGGATYTNRAADRGGPTKYGVTARKLGEYRRLGRPATADEVRQLTEGEARALYRAEFWAGPGFDRVATVSARIAEELLDTGVNMGAGVPGRWLQQSLNACNRRGRDWPDIEVDGQLGERTLSALRSLLARRGHRAGEDLVLKCLNGLQFGRYWSILQAGGPNGDQEENFVGWITHRIGLA
jgi:lysozyme family protein